MWTEEQSREVEETARKIVPEIKFHAIPYGLQVAKGPDAIVEYLTEKVPALLEAWMNRSRWTDIRVSR